MVAAPRHLMAVACLLAGAWTVCAGPGGSTNDLAGAWQALAAESDDQAEPARRAFASAGRKGLTVLAGELARLDISARTTRKHIADLDADAWGTRRRAHRALEAMGLPAEAALRQALKRRLSIEARVRIEAILDTFQQRAPRLPEHRRLARAVEILAGMRTPEAMDVVVRLRDLAPCLQVRDDAGALLWGLGQGLIRAGVQAARDHCRKGEYKQAARAMAGAAALGKRVDRQYAAPLKRMAAYVRLRQSGGTATRPAAVPGLGPDGAEGDWPDWWTYLLRNAAAIEDDENVLRAGGFEKARYATGALPQKPGRWGGDPCTVVGAEKGIAPWQGKKMLRLDATALPPSLHCTSSEPCQVVDVSALRQAIDAGRIVASASAMVNRVAGDAETDNLFGLRIYACKGAPSTLTTQIVSRSSLRTKGVYIRSDADPATWEKIWIRMAVPKGTTFLALILVANENVCNDRQAPELDGHYADDIRAAVRVEAKAAQASR